METQAKPTVRAVPVRIREDGSIQIPQELLEIVQWKPEDEVLVFEEDGHLVIMTRQQLADEIVKLLQVLKDADWDWLEEGRKDEPERL